jgi:hypothetical protein
MDQQLMEKRKGRMCSAGTFNIVTEITISCDTISIFRNLNVCFGSLGGTSTQMRGLTMHFTHEYIFSPNNS